MQAMGLNKAKLIGKTQLTHDVIELHFESLEDFEFKAGQFINIKIEDAEKACFRAYSIASAPRNDRTFDLCIKVVKGGRGSNWLNEITENTEISFIGPIGHFIFQTPDDKETVFIATGTGIAPFHSMIGEQKDKKMHLLFGVRHEEDIFYQDRFPNVAFDFTLSRPKEDWQGNKGRVTELVKELDLKNKQFYICGLKAMIDSVLAILHEKGVSDEDIHFEKYD